MFENSPQPVRRALISVSDKTGLVELASSLDALSLLSSTITSDAFSTASMVSTTATPIGLILAM